MRAFLQLDRVCILEPFVTKTPFQLVLKIREINFHIFQNIVPQVLNLRDCEYLRREMNRRVVSGTILALLLISISQLTLNIQQAKASGTIYIKADGSIDPPTAPISRVDDTIYIFKGNISETIEVQRDNVVIDGKGHTLQGLGVGNGFYAIDVGSITIKNVVVRGWEYGITLYRSGGNDISNNTINNNWCGIMLRRCSRDNVSGNTMQNNTYAILLREQSSGYNFSGNIINNNEGGIYLRNSSGTISCNTINNNTAYGIHLDWCKGKGNNISGNVINDNNLGGISLVGGSSDHNFSGNTINNNRHGIALWEPSGNNTISGNTIENSKRHGIYLWTSTGNNISRNTIQNNSWDGIDLAGGASGNIISGNMIHNNSWNGIALWQSSGNTIYHNNIINNSRQASDTNPTDNDWHHPDLLEGNYWSDYPGVDDGSGTGKHAIADDGIGDTHTPWPEPDYDNYPPMHPWGSPRERIYALIRDIKAMGLDSKVERKLVTVLQRAIPLLDHKNKKAPARALALFSTKVNIYERLHKLTPGQANQLRTAAYEIIRLVWPVDTKRMDKYYPS